MAKPRKQKKPVYTRPSEELALAVGRRVAALREAFELGQTELAAAAGMSRRALIAIEKGERGCSLKSIGQLAAALEVPAPLLLVDPEDEAGPDALAEALVRAAGSSEGASRALGRALAAAGSAPAAGELLGEGEVGRSGT